MSRNNCKEKHEREGLTKEQISIIFEENKNRLDKMLQEIDKKIFLLSVSTDNAISVTRYISLALHKISVKCAWMIFMKQYTEVVSSHINECVNWLEDIITMQEKVRVHTSAILSRDEINENYQFWSVVKDEFLHNLLIKENYILLQLETILHEKQNGMNVFCDIYCRFAVGTQSFIDIEGIVSNNSSLAKKNLDYCICVCSKAVNICLYLFKMDRKNVLHIKKADQFLLICEYLSKQVKETERTESFKKKREIVQHMLHSDYNK